MCIRDDVLIKLKYLFTSNKMIVYFNKNYTNQKKEFDFDCLFEIEFK